ncbi:hypothetical protein PVAG01_07571 [Phlyctema vagabunda]|uniref:Uncharacterized protein n=1 Tax=Phlyctema vagabunda TaxID=108571 RepID=A0ABR4PCT1_9HELO
MYPISVFLAVSAVLPTVLSSSIFEKRDDQCAAGYKLCAPAGASSQSPPRIGDEAFQNLLVDMVQSSLPEFKKKRAHPQSDEVATLLCCIESLDCVLMSNLLIPFCYDKFTTNYHLSDGSYGTIFDASYSSAQGDVANLANGVYTLADGKTGDIFSNVAPPDTATLAMPSQFQGSGIGGPIPAGALGFQIITTITSTIPATTVLATTFTPTTIPATVSTSILISPSTITASISSSVLINTVEVSTVITETISNSEVIKTVVTSQPLTSTILNSVVVDTVAVSSTSVSTIPETTLAASTRQATTISARLTTIITTAASSSSSASGSSTSTSTSAQASATSNAASRENSVNSLVVRCAGALFLVAAFMQIL